MNERTHIDLFTGLGGFSVAARANGVRTIAMCEADPRCQAFLAKAWPGVPIWPGVRTFDVGEPIGHGRGSRESSSKAAGHRHTVEPTTGECMANAGQIGRERRSPRQEPRPESRGRQQAQHSRIGTDPRVWLLTAGVPCQPASRAGKQRGASDDRWLWKEALEVFAAIRPAWAIFENPPGVEDLFEHGVQLEVDDEGNSTAAVGALVDRDGRSVFCETLAAIEAEGYALKILGVPACALNAPHRRMRYWIVCKRLADAPRPGHEERGMGSRKTGIEDGGKPGSAAAAGAQSQLAASAQRGQREHRGAPGNAGHADECGEGGMGDAEGSGSRAKLGESRPQQDGNGIASASPWSRYVWLPCADGKIRRAPDDTQRMVDGLPMELLETLGEEIETQLEKGDHFTPHRSLLGALGNSIVWQVAAEVIGAMIKSEG